MTHYFYFSLLGTDSQEMYLSPIKKKNFFSVQSFRKISYRPIHAKDNKKGFICTRETPFQCGLELDIPEHPKDIDTD